MAIYGIDFDKCIVCHKCMNICPMDVFGEIGNTVFLAYPEDCARCFLCDRVCPTGAIQIDAKRIIPYVDPFATRVGR